MDSRQHQSSKEKGVDNMKHGEGRESLAAAAKQKSSPSCPAAASAASPPSASSSPSHEFSFTISLHSSSAAATTTVPADNNNNKTKTTPPSFAIDLSPADDIFFHGHLLPLHLLSHLPVSSPRSSTNSLDSFTLPINDLRDNQIPEKKFSNCSTSNINSNNNSSSSIKSCNHHLRSNDLHLDQSKRRPKSKSFSLFGFTRWRKGYEVGECEDNSNRDQNKQKRKLRFDVSHVIRRYVSMIRPLLLFRGRRENGHHFQRQAYSFSGNLSFRSKQDQFIRGRRGEFSAPASIRTSPTNSGLLVATTNISSSTSDSTMEELQAAIQAAIAHCKNSIAVEEKIKC